MSFEDDIKHVTTLSQALKMRVIRNEVRRYMTSDQSKIGIAKQIVWYHRHFKTNPQLWWGYLVDGYGYGLIRKDDLGSYWVTGALLPPARGKGLGRKLFEFLTLKAQNLSSSNMAHLRVWYWNRPAHTLYRSLGYRDIATHEGVVTMVKT